MNRVLRRRLRRKAIITTHAGQGFAGVLFEADRNAFVLRDAEALGDAGSRMGVDGELLILAADVAYIQLP